MKNLMYIAIALMVYGCGGPEPRRPVEVRGGSFIKESVERNKALLAHEEALIKAIMEKDSLHDYISSASGYWYYYENKSEANSDPPRPGDLVHIRYNLLTLENETLYSAEELGVQTYLVDKEDKPAFFPGLRNSIKELKEGETATFLYPSSLAFGYMGDTGKIGPNVPLKSTLTLLRIEQQDNIKN